MKKAMGCEVLAQSVAAVPHGFIGLVAGRRELVCVTDGACGFADRLECMRDEYKYGVRVRIAAMNEKNSQAIRLFVKWTAPHAIGRSVSSIGVNDDFGYALPVWANIFAGTGIKPTLVTSGPIDARLVETMGEYAWQALATGLHDGYGAEYCAVQEEKDVMNALLAGYNSIVLDAGNKVTLAAYELDAVAVEEKFAALPEDFRVAINHSYENKSFEVGGRELSYTKEDISRIVLVYGEAIVWLQYIYNAYFKNAPWPVDFIVRLDAGMTVKAHYLLANELQRAKVILSALELPASKLAQHCAVAKKLGHKIRVEVKFGEDCAALGVVEKDACLLDIRPTGAGLSDALVVLVQNGDPLIRELFPQTGAEDLERALTGTDAKNIAGAVQDRKQDIAVALTKYDEDYKKLLGARAQAQKSCLNKNG